MPMFNNDELERKLKKHFDDLVATRSAEQLRLYVCNRNHFIALCEEQFTALIGEKKTRELYKSTLEHHEKYYQKQLFEDQSIENQFSLILCEAHVLKGRLTNQLRDAETTLASLKKQLDRANQAHPKPPRHASSIPPQHQTSVPTHLDKLRRELSLVIRRRQLTVTNLKARIQQCELTIQTYQPQYDDIIHRKAQYARDKILISYLTAENQQLFAQEWLDIKRQMDESAHENMTYIKTHCHSQLVNLLHSMISIEPDPTPEKTSLLEHVKAVIKRENAIREHKEALKALQINFEREANGLESDLNDTKDRLNQAIASRDAVQAQLNQHQRALAQAPSRINTLEKRISSNEQALLETHEQLDKAQSRSPKIQDNQSKAGRLFKRTSFVSLPFIALGLTSLFFMSTPIITMLSLGVIATAAAAMTLSAGFYFARFLKRVFHQRAISKQTASITALKDSIRQDKETIVDLREQLENQPQTVHDFEQQIKMTTGEVDALEKDLNHKTQHLNQKKEAYQQAKNTRQIEIKQLEATTYKPFMNENPHAMFQKPRPSAPSVDDLSPTNASAKRY